MSANDLLYWMSARGQGSWQQFRAAVEELHLIGDENISDKDDEEGYKETLPLYQALRLNLQRLGHAEFFAGAGEREWRIAPPTLAITRKDNSFLGVVTGARSLKVMERLIGAATSDRLDKLSFPASPDQIRIVADDLDVLRSVAENARLFVQENAPMAILASLPPIDHPAVLRPADLPFGSDWRVERFSASKMKWTSSTGDEPKNRQFGLFRFSCRHSRYVRLCTKGRSFEISGPVGKYIVLKNRKKRRAFSFDPRGGNLSVPAALRPPFLIERSLILCSGKLPTETFSTDNNRLHLQYSEISREIALFACGLLRQELV